MTRKFTFLLMAFLALAGLKSWGQEEITIGTGTSTTGYYPFYGLYNYSYSEMLYGAEEIGVAGNITAISFNASNATSKSIDFDLDIYMKNVSRTTHTSKSDWETVSASDKVCHATLSGLATGWITFTLDEPFAYDGTSTLMIAFDNNTGDYSSKSFYKNTSTDHKSLCMYLDGSNIAPSDPAATDASTNFSDDRPNIKINITPTGLASHTITYVQPDNDTVSGPAEAYEGRPVTLTATPDENYALGQFFVNGSPIEGNTFIMPASDVTVTATFAHFETLTVNNGTEANNYIPIYGYNCDASNQHNQFIIPAEQLADINGGTISSMTFYLSSLAAGPWGRTWTVKLMETTETTISSLINVSSATSVYTGVLNGQSSTMEVPFSTPYAYNGGNLLVDFSYSGGSGSYKSASFYGISTTYNSSYYNYNTTSGGPQKFLPKTTFGYVPNPNLHHITVTQPVEGGTISAPASAISGTTVTLTATPEFGYEFGEWITTPEVEITGNQFVMPASDVTITATFNALQQYDITFVGVDETLITVSATAGGNAITKAPAGTEVTLQYSNLDEGYTFINWTLNGEALAGNTFEMPANDVEIGVALNERPRYAVIIDGSIAHGTVTASPNENILSGKTVTLTVTPADSYVLNTLTVTDAESNPVAVTNNQFIMPESNVTVTATFSPVLTLTVNDGTATNNSVPFEGYNIDGYLTKSQFIISASDLENMAGGTITDLTFYLSGTQNKELPAASWEIYLKEVNTTVQGYDFIDYESMTKVYTGKLSIVNYQVKIHLDTPYQYNAASENPHLMVGFKQTAKGSGTWATTNWHGAEDGSGIMRSRRYGSDGNASYNFLPKTTFTYSNPNLHGITVNQPTEGGEIAASAGAALPGTIITLTATPELGYEFGEWIVSPSTVTITGNTFEMPASDVTVTATFNEVTQYGITFVSIDETLITVAATFGGETITEAPEGTEVTLEYTNLNEGYTFNYWTLNGEQLTGNTFTMPATDVEIGVNLSERPRFAVSIDGSITNGTITANPSTNILGNTTVTLTITPDAGYGLGELTVTDGSGDPVTVTNNQFSMPESNVTVTATFVPALTVYDGTATQYYAPVYTYYGDTEGSASQFMVPASLLEDMQGGTINSMKFYISSTQSLSNLATASYKGYIAEIEGSSMSTFIFDDASTPTIFDGTVSLTNNNTEMLITFSEPYTYNGGNLVIAFECTESEGAWTILNYYSSSATGGIIYRNGSATSTNTSNYVPKTTFYYTPGEVTYYDINMHVNGNVTVETLRANSTLQAPENIPAGLTFCGWTTTDIETYTEVAPAYQTKVTEVSDLYAVFSYTESEPAASKSGETWEKVTDASDLQAGDEIVLVYNNMIMCNREDATYLDYPVANVTISNDEITELPANAAQFTLVANGDYWNLQYEELGETRTLAADESYEELASEDLFESWSYTALVDFEAQTYNNSVIFKNADLNYYIGYYSDWNQITLWTSTYACKAYKKSIPMITTTYYMTEVLTSGEVTDLTTNNIIVASPITVSGRLEMNEGGLFRNENTANFVFADGAQFYYTGEESVNATFEKDITRYAGDNDNYYLIANPTDEDEVTHLTDNDYDLFTFNPGAALEWKNQHENAVIEQGTGYLYANSEDVTLQFAGELMPAGETTLTLVKAADGTGLDYPGFNLVGNPFACDAYIDGSFYRMNGTEFVSVANGPISPCEGIFVEASEDGEELAITTTAASKGANLELAISQGRSAVIDRAIVRFDESNDMHKFMMNPAHTNIRLAKNGQEYAAISSETEGEIPVSFMAEKDGSYTISVNTENVEANYLHLIDNMTGMDTDLLSTPSYTFNASTSDYAYRFKLVFNVEIGEANGNNGDSDNFAFMSNGNLVINGIEGEATMQIVDVLGRVVSTEIVSGSYNKALNLRAGLYIINLNGMTQKIVVK